MENNVKICGGNEITKIDGGCRLINMLNGADNVVCIHHNDMDGKAAAQVLALLGVTEFQQCDYNNNLINAEACQGKDVVIVDYSITEKDLEMLLPVAKHITLLDHHLSTMKISDALNKVVDDNPGKLAYLIDTTRSGAKITFEYYDLEHSFNLIDKEASSLFITLVDDYDRWVKADIRSDYINSFLYNSGQNYVNSSVYRRLFTDLAYLKFAIEVGKAFYDNMMEKNRITFNAFAYPVENFHGLKLMVIEGYGNSQLFPEEIMEQYDAVSVFHKNGDYWQYSLYSAKPDVAVNEIAEQYVDQTGRRGGGHKSAAGFRSIKRVF